ncbi:MAG: hypothetical protein Q8Q14_06490, partial [Gemmatimonadales bacterium]|nr:hypothetical protein [Gemmatimonadales bacterium]
MGQAPFLPVVCGAGPSSPKAGTPGMFRAMMSFWISVAYREPHAMVEERAQLRQAPVVGRGGPPAASMARTLAGRGQTVNSEVALDTLAWSDRGLC